MAKALLFMGTESVDEIPAGLPDNETDPDAFDAYKRAVIEHVVDFAFRPANVEKLKTVQEDPDDADCCCGMARPSQDPT